MDDSDSDGAEPLPLEVRAFLLVGRIVDDDRRKGVVRYCWTKFGTGQKHAGLPACYPLREGADEPTPMDMQFTYTVFWNGREDEQEVMGLEGVQAIATNEFTEEEWLPEAIRSLQRGDWGKEWEELEGDNAAQFLQTIRLEAARAAARAAVKSVPGTRTAPSSGPSSKPASKRASKKKKESQPLGKALEGPGGLAAQLQAKVEQRKRQAEAAVAGEVPSPRKRSKVMDKLLRQPAEAAAGATGISPSAARGRAAGGTAPPAAASPPGALEEAGSNAELLMPGKGANKRAATGQQRAQQQAELQRQQAESESCIVAAPSARSQPPAVGKPAGKVSAAKAVASSSGAAKAGKPLPAATKASAAKLPPKSPRKPVTKVSKPAASAGKAPTTSKSAKQATAAAPSPAKSLLSGGSGRSSEAPALRQHEQPPMAPADSDRLARDNWQGDCAKIRGARLSEEVYWFDRVLGRDGVVYRVWSNTLIVPEPLCYKSKADKRLANWKARPQAADADYTVAALLAERKDENGQTAYFVKWKGYEVDPAESGWLTEEGMDDCKVVLDAWKETGRNAWLDACHLLREQAGLA
ncbi:hypothetical protein D9Q98_007287 [Chlorella vulgaris]|uniref:Chromo domain-containing protein n=1 Tax=Chlorella vulgaris TaxID=3077 RepID=A0A9D4TKX0_CHLVU|nr:hypothetical protein D9Q98_007287 [Chlorella vulgaris]